MRERLGGAVGGAALGGLLLGEGRSSAASAAALVVPASTRAASGPSSRVAACAAAASATTRRSAAPAVRTTWTRSTWGRRSVSARASSAARARAAASAASWAACRSAAANWPASLRRASTSAGSAIRLRPRPRGAEADLGAAQPLGGLVGLGAGRCLLAGEGAQPLAKRGRSLPPGLGPLLQGLVEAAGEPHRVEQRRLEPLAEPHEALEHDGVGEAAAAPRRGLGVGGLGGLRAAARPPPR